MAVLITEAGPHDFESVARLHSQGITEGFLTSLGVPFLKALYDGINRAPRSRVLVSRDGDVVLGFACFSADIRQCYRWVLLRRALALTGALIPNLIKPSVYWKCLETITYPFRRAKAPSQTKLGVEAELLSIAVDARARGGGIGKALIAAVDDRFRKMGICEYRVVTHALDLRSNSFYISSGFTVSRKFSNHGKEMNEYFRSLDSK